MSGYVCIAMLEDPPYNIYLAATEEEPEDWCAGLPLPARLLCSESFQNPQEIAVSLLRTLQAKGIDATQKRAFKARAGDIVRAFMQARDIALAEGEVVMPPSKYDGIENSLGQTDGYNYSLDNDGDKGDRQAIFDQIKTRVDSFISIVSLLCPPQVIVMNGKHGETRKDVEDAVLVFLKRYVAKLLLDDVGNPITMLQTSGADCFVQKLAEGSLFDIPRHTLDIYRDIFDEELLDTANAEDIQTIIPKLFDELLSDGVLSYFIVIKHRLSGTDDYEEFTTFLLDLLGRIGKLTLILNGASPSEDISECYDVSVLSNSAFMVRQAMYFFGSPSVIE